MCNCGDSTARIIMKQGNGIPTIPPSPDHRNLDWSPNDVYEGEWYMDLDTGIVYLLTGGIIVEMGSPSGSANMANTDLAQTGDRIHDGSGFDWAHMNVANYGIGLSGDTTAEKVQIVNDSGDEVVEFYGDRTSRYFETVTFDKNLRLNDTFPAFINNGPSSGKQYDFKSEIAGFNTFSLVLGGTGGITQFNSNGGAFSMNQVLRFDVLGGAPPFIYSNSAAGRLGIDGGNTNSGHIVIWASGQVVFGAHTGDQSVHASAIHETKTDGANVRGSLIIPRMTDAQMNSIPTPAVGLMVYVTDATEGLYVYKSGGWTLVA